MGRNLLSGLIQYWKKLMVGLSQNVYQYTYGENSHNTGYSNFMRLS